MSDDPRKKGKQDRSRINTIEDYEVRYRSKKFGVPPDNSAVAVPRLVIELAEQGQFTAASPG
jgi:Protein of unknown function (DUF3606)